MKTFITHPTQRPRFEPLVSTDFWGLSLSFWPKYVSKKEDLKKIDILVSCTSKLILKVQEPTSQTANFKRSSSQTDTLDSSITGDHAWANIRPNHPRRGTSGVVLTSVLQSYLKASPQCVSPLMEIGVFSRRANENGGEVTFSGFDWSGMTFES